MKSRIHLDHIVSKVLGYRQMDIYTLLKSKKEIGLPNQKQQIKQNILKLGGGGDLINYIK